MRRDTPDSQKPVFDVCAVDPPKTKDGKPYFTRIGAAWAAKDGKEGFNIKLQALPLDGVLILRPPKGDDE